MWVFYISFVIRKKEKQIEKGKKKEEDYSMDKELAVGLSPEGGDQWLDVWMEISDKWCPTGATAESSTL